MALRFPDGFVWGSATSAYQIEGSTRADGRRESIWDRFCATPGRIEDGSSGEVACDHYRRWREDVALMKELGFRGYRFSIAWPRVVPTGRGAVNAAGLDFYSRLVDELLAQGIEPLPTLFHWDLPQDLQDGGGWARRATAEAFVEYADVVSRHLGDRVKRWITHNEPWCISFYSHQIGRHAPGLQDWPTALAVAHHVLLSHGWAVPVLRRNSPGAEVGITLNFEPAVPASPSGPDRDAARQSDGSFNRWFLDPVFGRGYPGDVVADHARAGRLPSPTLPFNQEGDLEVIAEPLDFLGVNYYTRRVIRNADVPEERNAPRAVFVAPESEWTAMGWEVSPEEFYHLLCRIHFEYRPAKLYVTENGASYDDEISVDGQVHDERRVRYLREHLMAAHRAIAAGVPLAGYFVWSLLDNFEWDRGYSKRFGIVRVDYETQERTLKDSARYLKKVMESNTVE